MLESVEEIRDQLRSSSPRTIHEPLLAIQSDRVRSETPPYRPLCRPPMALLHVFDDGESVGEVVRVRSESFVIGRIEGNLIIAHDTGMSGRHAEIVRRAEGNVWSWTLRDLDSTNGTFVRASTVTLSLNQEFMVGSRLFRFEAQASPAPLSGKPAGHAVTTRKWEVPKLGGTGGEAAGVLIEISKGVEVRRFALMDGEYWLGRDPATCAIVVDDVFVDPRHARIRRDEKGRWVVTNERSRNGLWGRITEVGIERGGAFQCGEQRFLFKPLPTI